MIIQVLKAEKLLERTECWQEVLVIVQCVASSKEATILGWLDVSSH